MTLSLLGVDSATGELGIAITSSSPAVAARCAFVRAGVGAAASQNVTDPRLGPLLLDALEEGHAPEEALARVRAAAEHADYRQLAVLHRSGAAAAWSGALALGIHGVRLGRDCVVAGNLLAGESVLDEMVRGFGSTPGGELSLRLLRGLEAGVAAGGERGPLRSAGLLVSAQVPWPVVDLRVDDHDEPVAELARLLSLYSPQREDYVRRALDPATAPAYGVPGEEEPRRSRP